MKNRVVAIVPAAGVGRRFGQGTNKTFQALAGKPLVVWSLEVLESVDEIKEIIPVVREEDMLYVAGLLEGYPLTKVRRIAVGGRERQDSVFSGLKLVEDPGCLVLIHDGARPLIEKDLISSAIASLGDFDGVVVGVPLKDTVKQVVDGVIKGTPDRSFLWAVQTPQIFRYQVLHSAYEKAMAESFYSTDDAALVEKYGGRVKVHRGSYQNIKVTTPEDLLIAGAFLSSRGRPECA